MVSKINKQRKSLSLQNLLFLFSKYKNYMPDLCFLPLHLGVSPMIKVRQIILFINRLLMLYICFISILSHFWSLPRFLESPKVQLEKANFTVSKVAIESFKLFRSTSTRWENYENTFIASFVRFHIIYIQI